MVTASLSTTRAETRRRLLAIYTVLLLAGATVVLVSYLGEAVNVAVHQPTFWVMGALSVLAGTQAFVTTLFPDGAPAIISPTLCFAFAILIRWGLGPAAVTEAAAMAVTAWRLKRPAAEAVTAAARYILAFAAASAILWLGQPDPFRTNGPTNILLDALSVAGAAGACILTYGLLVWIPARLRRVRRRPRELVRAVREQAVFMAALLVLSPVLAFASFVNVFLVPLVLIPLYAVQRMARLSAERDRAARIDPLTGLQNRTGLRATFDRITATPIDEEEDDDAEPLPPIRLLILDLDRFKQVNDALGHDVGDDLLVAVARRLPAIDPEVGGIARLGGDEFAILAATDDPMQLAADTIKSVNRPIHLEGLRVDVTASVGIATGRDGDFATLMRHADIAMYEAKQRNSGVAVYDPSTDRANPAQLGLLADFRQALENDDEEQIDIHYQPQIALATGQIEGVEALLRWWHPQRGPISPPDILALVEHTPVMNMLTRQLIRRVTAQVARWRDDGVTLRASINISARDLYDDGLITTLASSLDRNRLRPSLIQVEITERALIADLRRAEQPLRQIAALGISLSLDDFGTGYSSLQHLRRLPIAEIKIDQSFVSDMAHNDDDAAIVRSTINLAQSLNLRTVAEGVEDLDTQDMLAAAGCTLAQGWSTARPMAGNQIPAWLTAASP